MAIVAVFLSPIKELNIMPVPQLITTDCGVHWIPSTKENGEIVVSTQLGSSKLLINAFSVGKNTLCLSHIQLEQFSPNFRN